MDELDQFRKYIRIITESQAPNVKKLPEFEFRRFLKDLSNAQMPPLKVEKEDLHDIELAKLYFHPAAFKKLAPKLINEPENADISVGYICSKLSQKYPQLKITKALDFQKAHTGKDSTYLVLDVILKEDPEYDEFLDAKKVKDLMVKGIPVEIFNSRFASGDLITVRGNRGAYITYESGEGDQNPVFDYKGKKFFPFDDTSNETGFALVKQYDQGNLVPLLTVAFDFFKIH